MPVAALLLLFALGLRAEEAPQSTDRGTVATPMAPAPLTPSGRQTVSDFEHQTRGGGKPDPVSFLDRLLGSDPAAAKPYIEQFARLMRQAGQDPRLREMWAAYVRRNPKDPDAFSGLGQGAFEEKDYPTSVAAYTRAIALGARNPEVYYGRGLSADALGDHELAFSDAREALTLAPGDMRAYSLAKLTEGRPSSVLVNPATGRTSAARPGAPGAVLPTVSSKDSKEEPAPGIVVDPSRSAAVLTSDARRRLSLGDPIGALKAALAAVAANPQDAAAQNILATAYEKNGDHAAAVGAADAALALAPENPPALNTRAWALSGLRRFDEALGDARILLGLEPENAFGMVSEARALGGLGRRSEMIDALSKAAARDGRFADLRAQAVRLPQNADTELLFSGVAQAAVPRPAPKKPWGRFLLLTALTLGGGLLVALGLLHVVSPAWRRRVTERVREGKEAPAGAPAGLEVKRLVATGGMGMVYEAYDHGLRRKVALKRLRGEIRDDPKERERFLAEARTVAALEHPNIVRIHAVLEEGGEPCLVFEFAEGRTLKDAAAEDGPLKPARVLELTAQLAAGLDTAHAHGFIHRDLKPENVMLDGKDRVKIMDFGLARPPRSDGSATTVWGSPPYMAPEAEDGRATAAGDLYSLGATVYLALTGKPPFSGTPGSVSRSKAAAAFTPPSQANKKLPSALDAFMARALHPDPGKRFPSAKALHSALSKALA
ncbi:MAG: protein kinase [Elusimicrobia bacterium]|nr:protein kinase [Elusimicrobiota bacterium]